MNPEQKSLMDWIEARASRNENGCLIWKLAGAHGGKEPQGRYLGNIVRVRRVVVTTMKGKKLTLKQTVKCVHGEVACVEPSHMVIRKNEGSLGKKHTLASRAKMAAVAREKVGVLTLEAVADIRSQAEPKDVYASRYGIAREHINQILAHKLWKDYSNPFAGLLSANDARRRA